MKRKYQVKWYSYGLTEECSRNFFTQIVAYLFALYISRRQQTQVTIKVI